MGLWQWVQDKASSIKQTVLAAYHDTSEVVQGALAYLREDDVRISLSNTLSQFWLGFSRVLDPTMLVTLVTFTRPKTLGVMIRAQGATLLRLGQLLGYYAGVKPLIGRAVRTVVADSPVTEFVVENAIDAAATLYFTRKAVAAMLVDGPAYNMALSKTSTQESAEKEPGDHALMRPCEHGGVANFTANIATTLSYYVNWLSLTVLSRATPGGSYVFLLPGALLYGRAYLEYPLAAAGNCTEHRLEVLNKNNAYATGFGLANIATYWVMKELVGYATGVRDNFFVNQAISASTTFYFIALINLSRKLALPGDKLGMDVSWPARAVVNQGSYLLQQRFTANYQDKGDIDWYDMTKTAVLARWDSRVMRLVRRVLLEDSLQNAHAMARRSSCRLYLELAGEDIAGSIQGAINMRHDWFYQWINSAKGLMPEVAGHQRQMLSYLMDKHLERPLNEWLRFFKDPYRDPASEKQQPAKEGTYQGMLAVPPVVAVPSFSAAQRERQQQRPEMERETSYANLALTAAGMLRNRKLN